MTFSKQLFLYLFFFFPLLHASHTNQCSSSSCGLDDVHVRFPFWLLSKQQEFCGHAGFNLQCTSSPKTALKLPNSGTFLVREIDYISQQIRLHDPENCLARKLLTFDISGSPFSALYLASYTFLSCPNEVAKPSRFDSIPCLGNSTTSFLATTSLDLAKSMLPSCQIVKTLAIPVSRRVTAGRSRFSTDVNEKDLWLKWDSPSCSHCERDYLRCGFISNTSLQVKCFPFEKSDNNNTRLQVLKIMILSIIGPVMIFATCIAIGVCTSERFASRIQRNVAIAALQPNEVIVTTGLDEYTIESYKKMELGESRRLPGTNDIVCPICLSEYVSKETVRCIPECDHCFHSDCIDVWLKIHGSCPLCRNSPSPARSPFSPRFDILYTFLTCPNEVVLPSWYPFIPCLSNSTSSFFATSNFALAQSMLPSCQIVKRLHVPSNSPFGETRFSSYLNNQNLLLEWDSPDCRGCEVDYLRCGFKNKASLEIKCFDAKKSGHLSSGVLVLVISLSAVTVFVFPTCIAIRLYNSESFDSLAIAAATVMQQPREVRATRGLDQSTIETFKKMELGESRRLSGTNGIVCPICLSEYASKETVRFIPECDHCFHVKCIDVWLKIHGSCPLCRNSRANERCFIAKDLKFHNQKLSNLSSILPGNKNTFVWEVCQLGFGPIGLPGSQKCRRPDYPWHLVGRHSKLGIGRVVARKGLTVNTVD
ncbi:Wall-associated receptor kinase C-terminal [Arabidopsis suecica]|uniref:RING-type E3 ubiquitin transferase n=1 Tax=Arabidopsis suecica TaxID=45249 RepID=A0A8T2AQD4_ARASU|nr:Wall-associated receptor kinase C-terminal [Arabidopsis suecica]